MSFLPCTLVSRLEVVGVLPDLTIDIIIAAKTKAAMATRQATKIAMAIKNISRRSPPVDAITQRKNNSKNCILKFW